MLNWNAALTDISNIILRMKTIEHLPKMTKIFLSKIIEKFYSKKNDEQKRCLKLS